MNLRAEISTPAGKRRYARQLFSTIADRYDFITVALSYGQDARWKRRLIDLAQLTPEDEVLDLACGTGDLLLAASPKVRRAVGLDVTLRMLELAKRRQLPSPSHQLPTAHHKLIQADMLALPFPGASFTAVTTGYGLRNVPDLSASLREIHRVLTPRGRVLSLDFNRPASRALRTAYLAYLTVAGSVFGYVLHGDPDTYRYIPESIRNYPGAEGVARLLADAGFVDVRVVPLLGGLMAIHTATKP